MPLLFITSIFENLKGKCYDAKKELIFCRVMSNVRRAYKCLDNILAKSSITEKTDPIECKDR